MAFSSSPAIDFSEITSGPQNIVFIMIIEAHVASCQRRFAIKLANNLHIIAASAFIGIPILTDDGIIIAGNYYT